MGMSPPHRPRLGQYINNEAQLWGRHVVEADREWRKYLLRNTTVVVNTFQGQFKSTVSRMSIHLCGLFSNTSSMGLSRVGSNIWPNVFDLKIYGSANPILTQLGKKTNFFIFFKFFKKKRSKLLFFFKFKKNCLI